MSLPLSVFSCATDVNECEVANGGCEQICNNIYGSFECDCQPGYVLNSDGFNCSGKRGLGIMQGVMCNVIASMKYSPAVNTQSENYAL